MDRSSCRSCSNHYPFKKMTTGINSTYSGRKYRKANNDAVVYENISEGYDRNAIVYPEGKIIQLTGVYREIAGRYYWQIVYNADYWADLSAGWQPYALNSTQYTPTQAQRLVDGIIRNNQYILNNNLLCARFASLLSVSERQQLYMLQLRMEERNKALQNNSILYSQHVGSPAGWALLSGYLDKFMKNPGIGVAVSATAILITFAIVVASLSTAAYFAYRAYFRQSEQDVKFSKNLTETLQRKLSEQDYRQLLNETQGIVTKTKIKQQLASIGGNLKTLLLVGIGIVIALRAPKWIDAGRKAPVGGTQKNK